MSLAVKILAVIPAHNEAANLAAVTAELAEHQPGMEILVVDDASTDGTGDLLPSLGVRWLQLTQHLGLGCAMRVGLRYARMLGFDSALRLDGDGQHLPSEAAALLEIIGSGSADAAVGSRFAEPNGYRSPALRKVVHRILAFGLSRVTGRRVTDPTSGFWAFGPRALKILGDHYPHGYSEPELLLFLCRNNLSVAEVPVRMRARQGGQSTLTLPRAGLAVARTALAMLIVPRRAAIDRRPHA